LNIILILFNSYFIYENIEINNKIAQKISKKHSFYNFNENIKVDKKKIIYLIDLGFQESLNQNLYYLKLYDNNIITKNEKSNKFFDIINNKIKKIDRNQKIEILQKNLKENIIYFNYTFLPLNNLDDFFKFISNDFEYVVIETSIPFHLDDRKRQKQIKSYVEQNFTLVDSFSNENKIFLRSQTAIIHYYTQSLIPHEYPENLNNKNYEVVYGLNYSLYKIKFE